MSSSSSSQVISTLTYDQRLYTVLGLAVTGIVLSAFWIVGILINIEGSKASYFASVDSHSLEMEEETTTSSPKNSDNDVTKQQGQQEQQQYRRRGVRTPFKLMQLASVSVLLLLTYLLLVMSDAPMWASALGSLCVYGVFLRFQIGEELRRQRTDRLILLLSLFLLIASLMSLSTYSFKALKNGEIYEGPARIVGYVQEPYNNTDVHDPNLRMDLQVQWGKAWGCPLSGGKVCQANIQGALCTVKTDRRRQKQRQRQRQLQEDENDNDNNDIDQDSTTTKDEQANETDEESTTELEKENSELEAENEKLEKEVEELELENEKTQEVANEEVEVVEEEEAEDEAIYDEEVEVVEEEELIVEEEYTDAYIEVEEEKVEIEEENETDETAIAEDEETVSELEDEKAEIDEAYEEYEGEYADNAEYYEEVAEDTVVDEEILIEDEDETKEAYDEEIVEVAEGSTSEGQDEAIMEAAEETIDESIQSQEELGDQEDEDEQEWYYDEVTYEYDDDYYEAEYWSEYDWESVWGEYACEDLFDEDTNGLNYDTSVKAGEDDYPFVNIYGSCKSCEAYILDYFAEEAFESVQEHKIMAATYMAAALAGFGLTLLSFIKYKVRPPAENEIELLDQNGGVMA